MAIDKPDFLKFHVTEEELDALYTGINHLRVVGPHLDQSAILRFLKNAPNIEVVREALRLAIKHCKMYPDDQLTFQALATIALAPRVKGKNVAPHLHSWCDLYHGLDLWR